MPPSEISFVIQLGQKNFILIFQIFTPCVCAVASTTSNNVRCHIFFQKHVAVYPHLIGSTSNDLGNHFAYAGSELIWHCKNTPPSASSQLCEEIINFSFHRPDSCFGINAPGINVFFFVPQFLNFIKTLVCPRFFACSLHLIYWMHGADLWWCWWGLQSKAGNCSRFLQV